MYSGGFYVVLWGNVILRCLDVLEFGAGREGRQEWKPGFGLLGARGAVVGEAVIITAHVASAVEVYDQVGRSILNDWVTCT
jgi:hypothetical protein